MGCQLYSWLDDLFGWLVTGRGGGYLVKAGLELGEDVGHGDYGMWGVIRCGIRCDYCK